MSVCVCVRVCLCVYVQYGGFTCLSLQSDNENNVCPNMVDTVVIIISSLFYFYMPKDIGKFLQTILCILTHRSFLSHVL